jgi:hypothetical protein
MAWYEEKSESNGDFREDNLRRSLRLSKAEATGHLTRFKRWLVGGRCFNGDISSLTPEQVAEASAYPQDKAIELVKALVEFGFVSREPDAPPPQAGATLGGHAGWVGWLEECGEPTRKKVERQTAASGGIQTADDWLDSLLSNSNSSANPVFKLFYVLKYVKKDKDKEAVKTDKRWDNLNKDRQLPWCKKILQSYEGDLKKAATAMMQIGEYFENFGCSWDASTVHKRLTDWEEGRLGK